MRAKGGDDARQFCGAVLMAVFRRRRPRGESGIDLGTFEPPAVPAIAPIERVVDEGVLISASTVRMAIKNRLIVAALRDRVDYDPIALGRAARTEFMTLARENDDTADRLESERPTRAKGSDDAAPDTEGLDTRSEAHRRRPLVHRLLAAALREEAGNRESIAGIVESARNDAWQEIGHELTSRLHARALTTDYHPDHEPARKDRVREFEETDLADLIRSTSPDDEARAFTRAHAEREDRSDHYLRKWIEAGQTADVDSAIDCLSEDVVLVSPFTDRFVFRGRDQLRDLLTVALSVIEEITYSERVRNGPTAAVFYRARIGDIAVHEAQLLKLDPDGRISEITMFVRPLPALTALISELGPQLARKQHRSALARVIAAASAPLHRMAVSGEKSIMPRAAPK